MLTPAEDQLPRIAQRYRAAFDAVQELLTTTDHPKLPAWVFQLDRFDVVDIAVFSRALARAEQQRRQWRAALHATAELAALEVRNPEVRSLAPSTFDPDAPEALVDTPTDVGMDSLDAFISVVQYARTAGCSYVDGGFQPVRKGG
jgi:hypothetical protein